MNKLILSFLILLLGSIESITGQVVSSNPAFVTNSGTVEIIFDANQGNKGMLNATSCYAHTGVITNKSTGSSDWKYAPTWGDNSPKYKMTQAGTNKWKLTITPNITDYYGITSLDETVQKLAFVFRNEDGSKQGKNADGSDIFVNVYKDGLDVELLSPANNSVINPGTVINVSFISTATSELKLFIDNTNSQPVKTVSSGNELNHALTLEAGDYNIIAQALNGGKIQRDTSYICVRDYSVREARPANITEGINYNADGSVTFCIYAPKKDNIILLGDFNDFKPSNKYLMKYDQTGPPLGKLRYFWITIPGLDPDKEYAFQYLVDGTIRVGDPYCEKILDPWNDKWINEKHTIYPGLREYPASKAEDILSVFQINKPEYQWTQTDFTAPDQDNLMIYELLFRDFTTEGSVQAAIAKLDYLQSLGVNAIELMPIQEFDGNDSWGYNPNFYFAADKAYGTENDYKQFVDECHKRGMAVILDVVFNHSWGLSPMCKMWWDGTNNRPSADNPFYNAVAPHPYSVGSDFNHSEPKVREFFKKVLKHWLTEYKMDGFRFDLSKGFTQTHSGENVNLWGKYDANRIGYIKEYVDAIKETSPEAYAIMEHFAESSEENEIANHLSTMLWNNSQYGFGEAMMGWSSNSNLSQIKAVNRVSFMESHDEERLTYKAEQYGNGLIKTDMPTRMRQHAATAAFAYLSPGPRMMWQFGEMGYDYSIDYNGRTGRKPVRWDYLDDNDRKNLKDTYAKILNLRKDYPQVFNSRTTFNWQVSGSDWAKGKRMEYQHPEMDVIVVGNFNNTSITATPNFSKTGTWYELLSEQPLSVDDKGMVVQMAPNEVRVFTSVVPTSIDAVEKDMSIIVYPNPASDLLNLKSENTPEKIQIYAISGQLVMSDSLTQTVNIRHLPAGTYIIKVWTGNNVYQSRFIKK
ncbi:MAG: alpha-amylase family glycosyl hydrolase [Bacteroidales bacterium]